MLAVRRFYARYSASNKYINHSRRNPGINKQAKLLQESERDIENLDFDELESDFMGVHQSHTEHVEQMKQWHNKEKHLLVKQKYFKEKYPNFLTWHDKEQIRYLHNTDPDEWTIDQLSEGFPALPEIIQKIVKGKWAKKNQQKISNHDNAVVQNWTDFKQGKLNSLPDKLRIHLEKFSDRSLNLKPFDIKENPQKIINKCEKQQSGEFSEIIASYERLKKGKETENDRNQNEEINNEIKENYISSKEWSKGHNHLVTFRQLKNKINHAVAIGKSISVHDKLILNGTQLVENNSTKVELQPEEISAIVEKKYQTNNDKVGFVRMSTKDMSHLIYPEKITIPHKYYQKGYTYKLNDCYYDSDGEFLYRVPGMD